jgi:hypothetical protein
MNRNTKSLKDLVIIYADKLVVEVYNQALQDVKDLWLRLPEDTCEYTFEEELNKLKK